MFADSRCIEGEVPGYCPPPKWCNIGEADPATLQNINNNSSQISQHGGYLISSMVVFFISLHLIRMMSNRKEKINEK